MAKLWPFGKRHWDRHMKANNLARAALLADGWQEVPLRSLNAGKTFIAHIGHGDTYTLVTDPVPVLVFDGARLSMTVTIFSPITGTARQSAVDYFRADAVVWVKP